jgi:hypothetical protein
MRLPKQRHSRAIQTTGFVALMIMVVLVASAHGSEATGEESLIWLGCWQAIGPDEATSQPSFDRHPITCVSPGDVRHSLLLTKEIEGKILSEQMLHVDGRRYDFSAGGCSGWESARSSEFGSRIYLTSETSCVGGSERRTSAIHMLTAIDEWLEISVVQVKSSKQISLQRYRAISQGAGRPPLDIPTAVESARIAAAEPLHSDDVIEALRNTDPAAVEAMLLETKNRFSLDAAVLLRLAEAEVPPQVIDLIVALSFPDYFAVDEATGTAWLVEFQDPARYRDWGYGYRPYYGYRYWLGYGYVGYYPYPPHHPSRVRVGRAVSGRGYTRVRSSNLPSGGLSQLLQNLAGSRAGSSNASGGGGSASQSGYSDNTSNTSSGSTGRSSSSRTSKRRD